MPRQASVVDVEVYQRTGRHGLAHDCIIDRELALELLVHEIDAGDVSESGDPQRTSALAAHTDSELVSNLSVVNTGDIGYKSSVLIFIKALRDVFQWQQTVAYQLHTLQMTVGNPPSKKRPMGAQPKSKRLTASKITDTTRHSAHTVRVSVLECVGANNPASSDDTPAVPAAPSGPSPFTRFIEAWQVRGLLDYCCDSSQPLSCIGCSGTSRL